MVKLKHIIIIEALVILILLAYVIVPKVKINETKKERLLSPRVYEGILESKSFLILNYAPVKNDIDSFIQKNRLNVSVYIENMRSGAFVGINERKGYSPASLNKVLTAILIMKKVEDGELSLDSEIEIKEKDRSSAFGDLYKIKENKLPLRILLEKMLRDSDDTSFLVLNSMTDVEYRALIMSYTDYYSDESTDKTKPGEDSENGLVTPKSMYNIFSSLYLSTILKPENSEYILSLLTNTAFDINEAADLPKNVTIAHKFAIKYAGNDKFFHDCGIIYIKDGRIFYCVMTKDIDSKAARRLVGSIVHDIYRYHTGTRDTLDYYKKLYH
jgi:beta-lactamase class A